MAYFLDFDLGKGWWFYFALRYASETPEFKLEFEKELLRLVIEEGSFRVYGPNDKKSQRISMRGVRR